MNHHIGSGEHFRILAIHLKKYHEQRFYTPHRNPTTAANPKNPQHKQTNHNIKIYHEINRHKMAEMSLQMISNICITHKLWLSEKIWKLMT